MPTLTVTPTETGVTLTAPPAKSGLFARLTGGDTPASVAEMSRDDWALGLALSDLRALAEEEGPGALEIGETEIRLSHPLVASLDGETAAVLGLPPLADLTFETGVSGILGDAGFRLDWRWNRAGRAASPARTGAILHTERGDRRIPRAALDAIAIAEAFDAGGPLVDHWSALARFRQTLRPDEAGSGTDDASDESARIAMTGFLGTVRIASADAFSMSLRDDADGGVTFDPLPFSREDASGDMEEADARLSGAALDAFQREFGRRGGSTAYRVGDNDYLVIERSGAGTLAVMARKQRAPKAEREAFITNPTPALIEAAEETLARSGALEGEDDAAREALVEEAVERSFVQTPEYLSARVIGGGGVAAS